MLDNITDISTYQQKTTLIPRPAWVQKPEEVVTAEVCGDSLIEEDIRDGDKLICKVIFDKSDTIDGKLVIVKLPCGRSIVKRIYFNRSKIILRSSNQNYKDLVYDKSDIQIEAIVKGLIRNLE